MDPLIIINLVKESLKEVLIENNLTYNGLDIESILTIYSLDLSKILINYYPGATIMMNKNYKECATLVQGVIYNAYGVANKCDYFIADKEQLNYINKSFKKMSDLTGNKLNSKLDDKGYKGLKLKRSNYITS